MFRLSTFAGAGLALAALLAGGGACAQPAAPLAVVELFTSQGCSSCPPANDNVAALSERPGVLALSFGVTYWDRLGWKDTFAQPAFTERQYAYARALRHDAPFTPQVVVDGRSDVVGNDRRDIERLIAKSRLDGPSVTLAPTEVAVGPGRPPSDGADVWLVRFDPRVVQVPVRAGENTGRTLPHKNVVKSLQRLGEWRGAEVRFAVTAAPAGVSTAVLVQARGLGPILAAARG